MFRTRLAALLAAAAIVAACGSPTSTPTPSAGPSPSTGPSAAGSPMPSGSPGSAVDPGPTYTAIEGDVIGLRGLGAKAAVDPKILDDAGIKKYVADSFAKDNPPDVLAANERILKAFGLLPADASLSKLYIELLGGQVAGLYSPDDKTLYVVSRTGAIGPSEKTTFAHEFDHALQDQNFDLGSLKLDEIGHGDQSFARLSLVEGDATLLMSQWQTDHLTPADLGQMITDAGNDPSTQLLLSMPPILRESLLFPYTAGLSFVQGLYVGGGWAAVNAAYTKPPASTEQILHPDKYAGSELPIAVTLPQDLASRLGSGWTVGLEDSFGEFQMAVWLRGNTAIGAGAANAAAAGWGGDRIAVLNGPNGSWSVVLRTAWDSAPDAAAFEAAGTPLVAALATPGALLPGAGGTERWIVIASDDAALNATAGALGLAG